MVWPSSFKIKTPTGSGHQEPVPAVYYLQKAGRFLDRSSHEDASDLVKNHAGDAINKPYSTARGFRSD